MKYRIINIYSGFQNCYGDLPWRVMRGNDFIKAFKTRVNARAFLKDIRT